MNGPILLKQLCTVGAILLCLGVSGCRDDVKNIYKGDEGKEEPEKVPNDFDYVTTKSVKVDFKYDVPNGVRPYFEMYTSCPVSLDEDLSYVKNPTILPVAGGYTNANGAFSLTLDLASFVDELFLYSTQAGIPTLLYAKVVGNTANTFENYELEESHSKVSRGTDGDRKTSGEGYTGWPAWEYGKSINPIMDKVTSVSDISVPAAIYDEVKNSIETTVANTTSLTPGRYRKNIVLRENAEVKLYYFSHGRSKRQNSLTYFTYPGNMVANADPSYYLNNRLVMAFDKLSASDENKGVQLKYKNGDSWEETFPSGTALSFALLTGTDARYKNIAFSEWEYNKYEILNKDDKPSSRVNKPHMGVFKLSNSTDEKAYIVLCFEDYPWSENPNILVAERKPTFDDDVFIMEVNPKSALPEDIPDPTPEGEKNPFDYFVMNSGVWAFEDNWPKNGDYDMNDIVVSYIRTLYIDGYASPFVVSLTDEIGFLNNGATYSNAFGYVIGGKVKKDNIKSLSVKSTPKPSYSQNPGLDNDLDDATVMLFDNGKAVDKNAIFEVHVEFNKYPAFSNFSKDRLDGKPVNPFIVVNGTTENPRTEVHLPTYPPTKKNNNALFNTENDCSKGNEGRYYISDKESNYPFAIDLAGVELVMDRNNIVIPQFVTSPEGIAIDESYPGFINWVNSKGTKDQNWYLHPKK